MLTPYQFSLTLKSHDMNIRVVDRNNNVLLPTQSGEKLVFNGIVTLPNQIVIELTNLKNGYAELTDLSLGGIKFNQQNLFQLTKYQKQNSTDFEFTTSWNDTGKVYIELFERNPIAFHLRWKTTLNLGI